MFKLSPRMHRVLVSATIALLAIVFSLSLVAAAIVVVSTIDGTVDGWPPLPSVIDPPGDSGLGTRDILAGWIGTDAVPPTMFYFRIDVAVDPAVTPFDFDQIPMVQLDCDGNGSFDTPNDRRVDYSRRNDLTLPPQTVIISDGAGAMSPIYYGAAYAEPVDVSVEWSAPAADLGDCATASTFGVKFVTNLAGGVADDETNPFPYNHPTAVTLTGFQQRGSIVPFVTAALSGLGLSAVLFKRKAQLRGTQRG
jgi:hypothetical protein